MEEEILRYVWENDNSEKRVNLLDYFIDKYPVENEAILKELIYHLNQLSAHKYIRLTSSYLNELGDWIPRLDKEFGNEFFTLKKMRDNLTPLHDDKYIGIWAKINPKGVKEINRIDFKIQLKQVNNSVIRTNKLTLIGLLISLALSGYLVYLQVRTHVRDEKKYLLELQQELKDSQYREEKLKNEAQMNKELHLIYQNLSDTSKQK